MKKVLTKISVCLLFVFVMFSGIVLSACGENNENATLTLSTKNVEVLLGETENNTVSVRAYVDNASDSTVTWDCDETSLRITSEKINSRVTELSVTALKICDIDVTVSAAGKNAVFHVSAITPVKSISATTKKLCASYDKNLGGTFSLSSDLVVFSPQETGQKGLRYELANSVAGVSIVDNVLTLAPNIQNLPSSVWVDVISTAKENVRTSVNISIVPTIEVVAPYIQIVETQDGSNVRESYNLARNSQVENVLELSVYVANRENGYRILPRVKFENSNTGLVVNEIIQNQVSKNATYQYDGYVYDFKFSFDKISSSMGDEDNMCFEFYYEQFEGIMSQSEKINITTYDEVTKLAYVVGGLATEETLFDVYTSYPKGVNGLSFEFNALPTTARERDITLVCDSTKVNAVDINGNNIMVDGEGNVVNEIVIPSGTVVYFSAKDSNLAATQFTVKVKAGDSVISKTITLLPSIGLSEMNFYENGITVINPTYYLESQEGGQNSRTLYFYVKPANVSPEDLAITIVGNGFDIDTQKGVEYVEDVYGDTGEVVGALYKFDVIAHKNSQSSGNVEIKFPTGYSISCKVNTFIKLENVKVDVEATFDKSSSIGGISYIDSVLGINSISVKNGHNIPLVYTSEANIEYVSYRFSDFGGDIDVENEDSDYNNFDNLTPDVVETLEFSSNSYIISASYLRSLQLIAPSKVGKTWVEITFAGKMLDADGNFVDAYVRNYVCVEIYNPITAISVNTKYVKLYPYDEVGELNRELSETVLEVTLNNGGIAPTYKDIMLDYESVRNGVEIFKIEKLETEGNRYQVRVLTRTYKEGEESIRETDATIFFSVSNFGVAYTTQVRLVFESPVLVEKIETVNVPQKGIYLSTVSDVVSEKTFKIMTNVLPADALNKNLIYRFEPDYGTREDIINISADGFVSIPEGSTVGGSGKILVIPADARMVGDDGEEYYRESVENVVLRIDIKVADGTSEETALEISSLEQIGENTHLHYLLLNDVSVTDIHFDTFSGGLYGQRGDNEFVATITKIGNNLFGTLENGAIVKNINFAGEFVNSNGAVADENYGNLENVNVNVYYKNDKFVGSTVSGAEVAGGLIGKNFGTISGCTFAGSVSATSVVGGLVGENSGSIISSNVEIYNMKDQAMTFAAPAVGGLVGKANKTSVVQKSYINNYSSTFVATTMGAFASIIENGAKFDKCFAYNVAQTLAFAQDNLNEDKITDSYVMYEKADGSWDYVAYMTRTDGSTARYENVTNYSYVSFGTSKTWNKLSTKNYGYPYLNEVEAEISLKSEDLMNISIQETDLSLKEQSNVAVMFVYKTASTITNAEQNALNALNTISLSKLFGNAEGVIVVSSNPSIISTTASSVSVKNSGLVTLTIQSKYDYSIEPKSIQVYVLNYTSNFKLTYEDVTLANSASVAIKNGSTLNVVSSVKTSVALVNRMIALKTAAWTVEVDPIAYATGSTLGTHVLTAPASDEEQITFSLKSNDIQNDGQVADETKAILNEIISQKFNIFLTLKIAKGAFEVVAVNMKNAEISPMDNLVFKSYIVSDIAYNIHDDSAEKLRYAVYLLVEDDKKVVAEDLFEVKLDYDDINSKLLPDGKYKITYDVSFSVNNEYKNRLFGGERYTLRLFASSDHSVYTDIIVTISTQEVLRLDFNHYPATNDGYSYQPSNILTPNSMGILAVNVYPNYASYDYITITAQAVNGQELKLIAQNKVGNSYELAASESFVYIDGGVRIYRPNNASDIATFYVKTKASKAVMLNSVYTINIKVYNNNITKPLIEDDFSLIIIPQEQPGISINGETGTTLALKGDTIVADVMIEKTQSAPTLKILDGDGNEGGVYNIVPAVRLVDVNENYSTKYKLYKYEIEISDTTTEKSFMIEATTSRVVNKETQYTKSTMEVFLYDFRLDAEKTYVNAQQTNVFVANTTKEEVLDITIGAEYYGDNKRDFESFLSSKVFQKDNFAVNIDYLSYLPQTQINDLRYNLHYVNGNSSTPIYKINKNGTGEFVASDIVEFDAVEFEGGSKLIVKGLKNATQNMRLSIDYYVQVDGGTKRFTFTYDFSIKVEKYTDEDVPDEISNESAFLAINDEEIAEPKDYILTKDLVLYDYVAFENTQKINSIDGNGHTITIVNFKTDFEEENISTLNLALFNEVSKNTTLKNVRVNIYHVGSVSVDTSKIKTFNYAPLAITNEGIITNCEVVAYGALTNVITPKNIGIYANLPTTSDLSSHMAGFVITNNGSITNSRVGGEQIVTNYKIDRGVVKSSTTEVLPMLTIYGKGEMSGFVYENKGLISSSFASNIRIVNLTDVDYTTTTSGFVSKNSGTITMSYVKGVKKNGTEVHASKYGIETAGISAGFVCENEGTISDSYSNIMLTNVSNNPGRTSSGFVYNNKQNAKISTSYSFSRITNSKTTQMNFSGVDEWGEYLNQGTIENCYYYDGVLGDTETPVEESYNISAKRIYSVNVEEIFYGFGFESYQKNNSIWTLKSTGPELISANAQTTSLRYKLTDAQGNIVYPYADGYEYGSSINPIIIRTAKEYNEVLGNSKRTPVQNNYNATEVFGSYRLVNNIDLSSLSSQTAQELGATDYKLTSSKMILTGKYSANGQGEHAGRFDGNGLTISNFALADTATISAENFGLFAKVESNAIVMNLNVIIGAQNSEGVVFGIEAKNIENVGAIAGSVENANIVNVNVASTYQNTSEVIVRGKNIVGGIVGKVSGESYLSNLTAKDISVRAVMNLSTANISSLNGNALLEFNKYTRMGPNANVSYAGGVVGVLDYYTEETINNYSFSSIYVTNDPNFIRLTAQGVMKISASTSGGVIGLVGPLTLVQDIKIQLAKVEDDLTQSISSYGAFAGGLVGYNLGYLRQVRAEHEQAYQEEIESNVNSYYTSSKEERQGIDRGNLDLFNNQEYTSFAVGGLVGVMRSGKIEKAYSKLNVINKYSQYAGGVIGLVVDNVVSVGGQNDADVLDASFEEVYAFGDVLAQKAGAYTGGILGAIVSGDGSTVEGTSLEKVNAVNYWGDWLLDKIDVGNSVGDNIGAIVGYAEGSDKGYNSKLVSSFVDDVIVFNENYAVLKTSAFSGAGLAPYSEITNGYVDGEKVDVIFKNQNWETITWSRDDNELLPHMVFGYTSRYFYIRTQEDLNLMRIHKEEDAVFIIIGNEENNGMVVIDKNTPTISGFKGILRGKDGSGNYGFAFESAQSQPLFTKTRGAQFADFAIEVRQFESGSTELNMNLQNSALLIGTDSSSTLSNLKFTGIQLAASHASANVGVAVANGTNTSFSDIYFENCSIKLNPVAAMNMNAGILAGQLSGTGNITNVKIVAESAKEHITLNTKNLGGDANVGGLVGLVQGSNAGSSYNIQYSAGNSSINNIYEHFVISVYDEEKTATANVGLLVGSSSYLMLGSENYVSSYASYSGEINVNGFNTANVGGLVGNASNTGLFNTRALVNINVNTTNDTDTGIANVGGMVGKASDVQLNNNIVGYNKTDKENINQIVSNNIKDGKIGGVIGYVSASESNILRNIYAYQKINIANTRDSFANDTLYAGGLVGLSQGWITNIIGEIASVEQTKDMMMYAGDMYIGNIDVPSAYIGGMFGSVEEYEEDAEEISNESELSYLYFGGNVKFNDSKVITLNVGGLSGYLTNNVQIKKSVSYGNIGLLPSLVTSDSAKALKTANEISGIDYNGVSNVTTLNAGGLVGLNKSSYSENVSGLSENISLTTIINAKERTLVSSEDTQVLTEYNVGALIGKTDGEEVVYPQASTDVTNQTEDYKVNQYVHVLTLCTDFDTVGSNMTFANAKAINLIQDFTPIVDNTDINEEQLIIPSKLFAGGSKLNPLNEMPDSDENKTYKYIYLVGNDEGSFVKTSYEVKNAHVFGDGFNILTQNVPFASVSSNSVIAGIVVRANVKITGNAENKKIAGLVGQNDGFVYSCNVTGGSAIYGQGTSFDDTMGSIVANTELVAGLVAQNSGTIKDCFTYANVGNTAKNASEGKNISDYISGGLVANNEGLIFSSYTSGQVTTAGATLYAFSNGNVFDCYTISKVVGIEDEAIDMYAFDDDAQVVGSYYDVYATERELNINSYTITDYMMGYSTLMPNEGSTDSEVLGNNSREKFLNQMVNVDEKIINNNVFEFSLDKKYNYGYAYFGKNGYANIDYMHHQTYTDNGTESVGGDDIYQIPNIGVLEQLRYSKFNDKSYVLVNDIECKNLKLTGKDNDVIFPSFDFAGKLDGIWGDPNNKSIDNLKVVKGLFGNLSGEVSNISLINFVINNSVESSADNNGDYNCGILAAQNSGTINSVNVKYDKICEDFEYFESQNNKTIADTFSLGLIAGNNIGSINNSCVTIEEVENAQFIVRTDFPGGEYKNFGTIAGISSGDITNCWFSGKLFTAFGENYEQDNADVEIHNQGGIVGKVTSGKVELCYLSTNASVNFLTGDAEVEDKNAVNMTGKTLNAGGIVGFVNGGQIEKCYTIGGNEAKNTEIRGGNKYSIEISYIGGICGLIESGTLNACYNKADVTAYARVQYIQDSWSSVTVEYDELLYAKYNELAYGAGIANGIKIEVTESDGTKTANSNATESINYGKVKGGVYVETIMGFFDFNDELLALRPLIFTAAVRTGVGFIKIGISLCSNPYTLGAGIAKIAIGTGIIAAAAAQVFVPTPVYGYYTKYNTDHLNYMENLEGGGLDYFHGAQASYEDFVGDFKKSLGDALKNLVNFNVINQLLNAMPPRLATNFIYHYSGEFDIADIASFDFGILSFSIGGFVRDVGEHFSGEWAGIKFKDGYAYYEEQGFAPGVPIVQNHLYVYDSYYNGISNNVNGTNYNPENDELAKLYDNSAHNYYTKPLGEYSDHHYLNSNSGDNKLLYKLSDNYDVNKKFSKNIDITEKPSEDWTFDDDSEKWVLVDGKEGQTVQFAKLKLELKDEIVVITVDEEISLKTVGQIITNFENYAQKNEGQINTATNLTLDQFKEYIENGNYEIYVAKNIIVTMPWSPIAKDVENVHSYFNGSINGDNNSIEINSVYTTNNEIAFIANSQNAKIRNLNVDIKIEYVSEETQQKTIAALIANAEGETKIENCQTNVEIYDYVEGNEAEDIEEKVSSSAKIGGLVGMANGIVAGEKANISVTSSSVSGTIHSKANKGTNGLIGGVIGSTNIGSTIKLEELETSIEINAEKSTNVTAGGLIAEVKETTNEIVISDVVVNDNVVVLAKENSDYVYVGGIIGKANIKYEQQININNCNIECCQISGDVITENHGTTYVGGLIGLLESTGSASISACKLGKNSEELALKLYISSGFVENTKPATAYVGDYVGFGVYEIGNGMKFNAKSIAIASYRYQYNNDIDFNNSNQNETLAINVTTNGQVINHVGDIVNKENDAVTNGTYLMTIKTNKQYCTNFDNSYVNQQPGFGFYNYKQTYYIIYASVEYTSNNAEIKDENGAKKNSYEIKSGDAHIDTNSELFKYYEKVYKLDLFYGLGVGNSEYDSNYVVNYNFDSIVENCYMLDKNIYKSELWKVENRSLEESTLFMPKLDKVGYYVTNNGIVQGTIEDGETYDTYEYCSINSIKSYNIEGSLTSYPFRRSSLINEEVDNYGTITQEFSSLPSLTIKGTVSKDEAKTTETSKLKLEFNYDDLVIKDIRTGTEAGDIEIFKLENISSSFNQGYTKIGTISEPAKQQTINMIQLGNNTYPIGGEELKTLDSDKQIIVSQSNDTNHKYVIISELYSDGNVEEKIYEFRSDRIYYLGSISYTSNIENWENITRNRMFFPTSGVLRQNNNLFSLGNEQEVSGLQFAHEVENKLQLNIFKYDELQVYHITQPYEHKCRLTYKTNSGWQLKTIGSGPSTTKEVEKDTETYVYDNYKIGDNITITMPNEIVYNISQNDLETIYTYKLNADGDAVDISKLSQEQIDSLVTSIGTKTNTIGFNGSTIEYDIYVLENQAKFVFNGKYVVVGQISEGVVQTLNSEIELTETLNGESIASVTADIIGTNYDIFAGKQTNPDILAENGYVVTFTNDGTREYVIKYNNTVIATITGKAFDKIENDSIVFNGNVGKDLTIEGFDQNYINYNSSNSKLIVCLDGEISIYGAGNLEEVQYQINGYTITHTYDSNAIDTTYASKDGKTLAIAGCDEKLTEYTFKVISVGEYALLQGYTSFGEIGIDAQNVNKNILAVLQNFYSADLSGRVNSSVYSNPSTLKQMLVVNMGTNIFTFVEGTQNEISVIEDVSANKSILTSMSGYSNLYNFNYVKFSLGTNVENSKAYYFDSDGVNISDEIETSNSASFDEIVNPNKTEAETYYFVEYSDKVVFIFENAIIFESDTSYKYARLMPWANGGYIYEICKDNTMSYSEANQDGSVYYSRYGEKLDFKEFNETSFNVALDNTSGLVPKADGVHTVKVFTVYMGKKEVTNAKTDASGQITYETVLVDDYVHIFVYPEADISYVDENSNQVQVTNAYIAIENNAEFSEYKSVEMSAKDEQGNDINITMYLLVFADGSGYDLLTGTKMI